jgi:hypothetical protein
MSMSFVPFTLDRLYERQRRKFSLLGFFLDLMLTRDVLMHIVVDNPWSVDDSGIDGMVGISWKTIYDAYEIGPGFGP